MKKIVVPTIIILVTIVLIALIFDWGRKDIPLPDGVEIIATNSTEQNSSSTSDMPIVVDNIKDNQEVSSPLKIKGRARGNWFFEASFPVELVDIDGNVLAREPAQALSDWMTTDFVNFSVTLNYTKSTSTNHALLVLSKDNPSGNPEFDQSIFIPVILK
ncbi:MAG: Gmad2 immunoglobulin-like domain-containing protein [Candidatus Paceibacterota bacterium]|jgi:hypothetical protein